MNLAQIIALIGVFVFIVVIPFGYAWYRAWKIVQLERWLHENTPRESKRSISTPLGHMSFRVINPHASLEAGIERARRRVYVPKVEETECSMKP